MRLRVQGHYAVFDREQNEDVRFKPGQVIEVSEAAGKRYLRDSPGSFAVLDGVQVDPGGPDEDEFSPDPDVERETPAPVRGQQPLREGSRIADVRTADRESGETHPAGEKPVKAPAEAPASEPEQPVEQPAKVEDTKPAEQPAEQPKTETPEGGATVIDVDGMTMAQLKELIAARGLDIRTVGVSTEDVRDAVKAAVRESETPEGD